MHLDASTLNLYFDRRLEGREARQAQQHLRDCATCRARLSELQLLTTALQAIPETSLSRDLSGPVLKRLRSNPARRFLGWLTLVEALGATSLAPFLWPRLGDLLAPIVSGPSLVAFSVWVEAARASLTSVLSQIALDPRALADAVDSWSRLPPPIRGPTMPLVAMLGIAAVVLGVLGNGMLLRTIPDRTAQPSRTSLKPSE